MKKQILCVLPVCLLLSSCFMNKRASGEQGQEQAKDSCFIENLSRFTRYSEEGMKATREPCITMIVAGSWMYCFL